MEEGAAKYSSLRVPVLSGQMDTPYGLLNNLLVIIIIDVEEKTCGSSCIIGI